MEGKSSRNFPLPHRLLIVSDHPAVIKTLTQTQAGQCRYGFGCTFDIYT